MQLVSVVAVKVIGKLKISFHLAISCPTSLFIDFYGWVLYHILNFFFQFLYLHFYLTYLTIKILNLMIKKFRCFKFNS